ncbi:MAG: DUF4412 domain-containing protein [Flavobacteriales bacterium]|nr:DUF4412 domain-containing protein [Flavobacteriales bacterium]
MLLLYSCEDFSFHNGIKEGRIEYSISYPDIPEDSYILDLMPKTMKTTFSNNNYRNDIIAGMGLFKTSIICHNNSDELIHSVKMLNKKYASKLTSEDLDKFNPEFNNIEIKLTDKKKEIAGYHCKNANITVIGDSTWTFELYYTEEIIIKNANIHTPFKSIKGVLMEYELTSYDMHMHFIVEKVIQEEVDLAKIELEDGYEMIAPSALKEQIESIFSKVR